jgi:AcrR family transcriptional regulator
MTRTRPVPPASMNDAPMTQNEDNAQIVEDGTGRTRRADAERNRRRLLDAATQMFCERGLDVGVGEIAQQAGVGRGTLFRNFPTKEHLIAAIVSERINESVARGRAALESDDPGDALFALIDQSVTRSQSDRALFDALSDDWMANDDIRCGHVELIGVLEALLHRAQAEGTVRSDVSAVDVIMMVKGVIEAGRSFQHVSPDVAMRQLDLVRAALSPPGADHPLRGRQPTIQDLEHAEPVPEHVEPAAP